MTRRILVAGNWKMHKTVDESVELATDVIKGYQRDDVDVLLAPTFVALYPVAQALKGSQIMLAAQSLYWEDQGPYTAEVSAPMIKSAGATHVIIGHSERRQYFGESEKTVALRMGAALKQGLIPIFCIGETKAEREGGHTEDVLISQIAGGLAGLKRESVAQVILAYEPVWAIGTGLTASDEQANQAHAAIREYLAHRYDRALADNCRILYGGSVKPGNAHSLLGQEHVDGALVGGASLTAEAFCGIINAV